MIIIGVNMKHLVYLIIYIFKISVVIFWILDICNMPFMVQFDTVYPLNTLFWLLVWMLILDS